MAKNHVPPGQIHENLVKEFPLEHLGSKRQIKYLCNLVFSIPSSNFNSLLISPLHPTIKLYLNPSLLPSQISEENNLIDKYRSQLWISSLISPPCQIIPYYQSVNLNITRFIYLCTFGYKRSSIFSQIFFSKPFPKKDQMSSKYRKTGRTPPLILFLSLYHFMDPILFYITLFIIAIK